MEGKFSQYPIEMACCKKQINDIENPDRNHPIHDNSVIFTYLKSRFYVAVVFDGVSESRKKGKNTVAISRELQWDLEKFCRQQKVEDIHKIAKWFQTALNDEKYKDKGATTVSFIRYDDLEQKIEGFTVGDSPALVVRSIANENGETTEGQILSALHTVANDPGVITRQLRFGNTPELTLFQMEMPEFDFLYLVAMSDGYGKMSDSDTLKYMDDDLQDRKVSIFYPFFAKVHLPKIISSKFPEIRVDNNGLSPYLSTIENPEIGDYINKIYDELDKDERQDLAIVDLDTMALYDFYRDPESFARKRNLTVEEILEKSHPSLGWMLSSPYNESKDESGLDEYLREYVKAEIFAISMIDELNILQDDNNWNLQKSLNSFFSNLDPIGDDFAVAITTIAKPAEKLEQS
ncbi:MAG: hypothetical protein ACQES9_09915 [Myxococcota bacterium]